MKQFSLEEYLKNPNQKIVTRDGRAVTKILCTDAKGDHPIVALVESHDGTFENSFSYTNNGKIYSRNMLSGCDLFFESEGHEGWINIYKYESGVIGISSHYFTSKKETEEEGKTHTCSVTTIKIEWEE